jgi:hypothetical protein
MFFLGRRLEQGLFFADKGSIVCPSGIFTPRLLDLPLTFCTVPQHGKTDRTRMSWGKKGSSDTDTVAKIQSSGQHCLRNAGSVVSR